MDLTDIAPEIVKGVKKLQINRIRSGFDGFNKKFHPRSSNWLERKRFIIAGKGKSALVASYKSSSSIYKANKANDPMALVGTLLDSIDTQLINFRNPTFKKAGFIKVKIESDQDKKLLGLAKNGYEVLGLDNLTQTELDNIV